METILGWWTLSVTKVGLTATLLLLLYVVSVTWWAGYLLVELGKFLRYQLVQKRRLRRLHAQSHQTRVVALADRLQRRRTERLGGSDVA